MIKNLRTKSYSNSSFVIVPIPLKDELLSSWLIRTSYSHHLHPITFINLYFGVENRHLFKKNIDTSLSEKIMKDIQHKAGNKVDINSLTFKSCVGFLQEHEIIMDSNRFFSNLKFCPVCLREDKVPYFRKIWKMTFSNICTIHNCYLYDACPKCNTRLSIFKMHKDKLHFSFCHNCGFELKKARKYNVIDKYSSGHNAQLKLIQVLENGYIILGNKTVYSFYFFDTIVQLTKLIISKGHIEFIKLDPLFLLLKKNIKRKINTSKSIYMQLDIRERFALFGLICYLFENYPTNFSCFMQDNNLTNWDMKKDFRRVSFWYDTLVNDISPRYVPFGNMTTAKEIEYGKKYLISQGLNVTKANLSRLFGNINYFSKKHINICI